MTMQCTVYVAGWAVVIQSLGSCLGLGSGYPEPWILPGAWVAWQWLSRALDPASLRRACVLGGRIQSLDPVAAAPVWGVRGSGYPEPWILPRAGRWYPEPWIPSQRRTWGLGSGYPEPWILPRGVCLGGWAVVSRALDPVAAAPSVSLAVVIQSLGSCLAGPYLEALTASCQVGGKGLGSGYPEPWILPGPWARNAAKLF